jgi:membrane protease YdiL (CAAX protease family)
MRRIDSLVVVTKRGLIGADPITIVLLIFAVTFLAFIIVVKPSFYPVSEVASIYMLLGGLGFGMGRAIGAPVRMSFYPTRIASGTIGALCGLMVVQILFFTAFGQVEKVVDLYMGFTAGVMEELFFRYFLLNALLIVLPPLLAIVGDSILFSIFHLSVYPEPLTLIVMFNCSLILAYIAYATRTVTTSALGHSLLNIVVGLIKR